MQEFEPEASSCLQNLKTLSIDLEGLNNLQFDSFLQVQNSFPNLVNIELIVQSFHKMDPTIDLQKVTHLTGYKCLENPFKILYSLSSGKVVQLIRCQLHQGFTRYFYAHRSQKCKKVQLCCQYLLCYRDLSV